MNVSIEEILHDKNTIKEMSAKLYQYWQINLQLQKDLAGFEKFRLEKEAYLKCKIHPLNMEISVLKDNQRNKQNKIREQRKQLTKLEAKCIKMNKYKETLPVIYQLNRNHNSYLSMIPLDIIDIIISNL